MSPTISENELLAAVAQLTNLVAVAMTKDLKQVDAIELLCRSTLSNGQIATILGTTPDTVRVTRHRLKRDAVKPSAKAKKASDDGTPAEQ